jgi:hypothetical protein
VGSHRLQGHPEGSHTPQGLVDDDGVYPANTNTSVKHDGAGGVSCDSGRDTVGLTRLPGANNSQISCDLGIGSNLIHRWRRELEDGGKKAYPGNGVARD